VGDTTALSGSQVSRIHRQQIIKNPTLVKYYAMFHRFRYHIMKKFAGQK